MTDVVGGDISAVLTGIAGVTVYAARQLWKGFSKKEKDGAREERPKISGLLDYVSKPGNVTKSELYMPLQSFSKMPRKAKVGGKKRTRSTSSRGRVKTNRTSVKKPKAGKGVKRAVTTKTLAKRVSALSKVARASIGTLIYRNRETGKITATAGQRWTSTHANVVKGFVEESINDLKFYDPTTPGTLLTVDGNTGAQSKEIFIKSIVSKFTVKNNFQVPMNVTIYFMENREDTSISPLTAFNNGLADVGNPSNTSSLVYPTDSPYLKKLWNMKKSKSLYLQPGASYTMTCFTKGFRYNPGFTDSHALDYQNAFHGSAYMTRLEGPLGHDSTANVNRLLAALDFELDRTVTIEYDAGMKLKIIRVNNEAFPLLTSPVVSNKPVADQQGFNAA